MLAVARAAALLALLAAPACGQGQLFDEQGLVQRLAAVQAHGPASQRGKLILSREDRLRRVGRRLASYAVVLFMLDAERWGKFTFGNGEGTANTTGEVTVDADPAVCTDADRGSSQAALVGVGAAAERAMEDLPRLLEDLAPALDVSGLFSSGGPELQAKSPAASDFSIGKFVTERMHIPMSCVDAMSVASDVDKKFDSAQLMGCMQEMLNVTSLCLNCLPRFGRQVARRCTQSCEGSLADVGKNFTSEVEELFKSTVGKSAAGLGIFVMPGMETEMLDMVNTGIVKADNAATLLAPCLECMEGPMTDLAQCMFGDTTGQTIHEGMVMLVKGAKEGHMLDFMKDPLDEVGGYDMEEEEEQESSEDEPRM